MKQQLFDAIVWTLYFVLGWCLLPLFWVAKHFIPADYFDSYEEEMNVNREIY